MSSGSTAQHTEVMHRFASTMQIFAGKLVDGSQGELIDMLERISHEVPEFAARADQLAVEAILRQALRSLYHHCGFTYVEDELDQLDSATFRKRLDFLRATVDHHLHGRVLLVRAVMQRRHSESRLTAADVAREMNMSVWHMTRVLKRYTGQGFRWHLRSIRILHARRLLASRDLSVKEIAATVGYSSTSEFDRQFKSETGITPSLFQSRLTMLADAT